MALSQLITVINSRETSNKYIHTYELALFLSSRGHGHRLNKTRRRAAPTPTTCKIRTRDMDETRIRPCARRIFIPYQQSSTDFYGDPF